MLHFIDGRFHYDGISFALPNEYYFDPIQDREILKDGIRLVGKTQDYHLQWNVENACESTSRELEISLHPEDGSDQTIAAIEAIQINGLNGHKASYSNCGYQFFEMRLALKGDTQFVFRVETKTGDIQKFVQSAEVQQLIGEIRGGR